MSNIDKISGLRTKIFVWLGLPAIALIALAFGAFDLIPAWQAKEGKGTPGTFTAIYEECSRRNCDWIGDFTPAAGGGTRRTDVRLYDEPDGLEKGDSVPALDTGARKGVFSAEGGLTWLFVTAFVVAGVVAAVAWVVMVLRTVRKRRAPAPADPFAGMPQHT